MSNGILHPRPKRFFRIHYRAKDSLDVQADFWTGKSVTGYPEECTRLSYFHSGRKKRELLGETLDHGNGIQLEADSLFLNLNYGQAGDLLLLLKAHHDGHGERCWSQYTKHPVWVRRRRKRK